MSKILGRITLDKETATPKIENTENVYVDRLEKRNPTDTICPKDEEHLKFSSK